MSFEGSIFDLGNDLFYTDPNMGRVVSTYTPKGGSAAQKVVLLDADVEESQSFGTIQVRDHAAMVTVRLSEVPVRPAEGGEIGPYKSKHWIIKTSELDSESLNWVLDLRVKRGG